MIAASKTRRMKMTTAMTRIWDLASCKKTGSTGGEGRFSTNAESEKVKGIHVASETQVAYFKQLGGEGRNRSHMTIFRGDNLMFFEGIKRNLA
jgi:hypothetical protein